MARSKRAVAGTVGDLFDAFCHSGQIRIVFVNKYFPFRPANKIVQFPFGLNHSFERAESFQMGASHIGNNTVIGRHDFYQFLNIARTAGAHFDNGHFVFVRQAKQGKRYSDMIVQVPFGV